MSTDNTNRTTIGRWQLDKNELPVQPLVDTAIECAERLLSAEEVLLVSHIDADGLTSAAVGSHMLARAEIPFEVMFSKQLDADDIEEIGNTGYDTVLFTDFGSGQLDIMETYIQRGAFEPIICDHHEPKGDCTYHLNPLCEGVDGSSELSGAGTVYVLSRVVSQLTPDTKSDPIKNNNTDLSAIALVGAIGDMQGGPTGVSGANEDIVEEGVEAGVIEERKDITLYGKQTRPIHKLLEYSTEIRIPGITGTESGAAKFLNDIDIPLKHSNNKWKHWVDLTEEEKQTVISELISHAISAGVPSHRIDRLVGTVYELKTEENRTAVKDTSEFSTLLNATARYERETVGLNVAKGDRGEALEEAKKLLRNHQQNISDGIDWVAGNGVTHEEHIQWFDSGDRIRPTIVGIIAGMSFGEGNVKRDKPVLAFAEKETDGEEDAADNEDDTPVQELKVSARGNRNMTRAGLDLSVVMEQASQAVGGDGGGHDIAAGCSIPADNRDEFIAKANEMIGDQMD